MPLVAVRNIFPATESNPFSGSLRVRLFKSQKVDGASLRLFSKLVRSWFTDSAPSLSFLAPTAVQQTNSYIFRLRTAVLRDSDAAGKRFP